MRGTVTKVFPEEGYGFIEADGQEYFWHMSALLGTDFGSMAPGVPVVFDVDRHPHGDRPGEQPRATEIRLADDAPPAVGHTVLPERKVA